MRTEQTFLEGRIKSEYDVYLRLSFYVCVHVISN